MDRSCLTPKGIVAAIRAAQLSLKTAIVEKKYWGGILRERWLQFHRRLSSSSVLIDMLEPHKARVSAVYGDYL